MFCPYCGASNPESPGVDLCQSCGRELHWSAELSPAAAGASPPEQLQAGSIAIAVPGSGTNYSPIQPIWQIALISCATLTFYSFYWYVRTWHQFNKYQGTKLRTGWRALGLIVPICNLALIWGIFDDINHLRKSLDRSPSLSPGWAMAGLIVCNLSWRLPEPFYLLTLFAAVPLMFAQRALNAFWAATLPGLPVRSSKRMLFWVPIVALWAIVFGYTFWESAAGIVEVERMNPWPASDVSPAAALMADVSHLGLEVEGFSDAREIKSFLSVKAARDSEGRAVGYVRDDEEVLWIGILRYSRSGGAGTGFAELKKWAESDCNWSSVGEWGSAGAINCGFDDAHIKILYNDVWLLWIEAYEGTELSPGQLAEAVRDAFPAHWRKLRNRSTSNEV